MPELFNSPLAIIDVETTGMSYKNGGVIDVGILRVEHGQVVQTMQQLVNPGTPLPSFITQLTGITNEDVADAPLFDDIARDVYDLLEGCVFIAHNARFDYAFIKEEFSRTGYYYQPKQLCTVKLSKGLYPQYRSHKLDALIERFNISVQNRHRAYDDAEATWQALQIMADQHPEEFDHKAKVQLRQPSLPANISAELLKNLPKAPGVYIFTAANGATLYVGKSINIYDRVLSHFNDDHRSVKEMRIAQEIADIQTIPTTGELGALLKESQLIKELMPLHNRMLRRKSDMVLAISGETPEGYPTVRVERHAEIAVGNLKAEGGRQNAENARHCEKQRDAAILLNGRTSLDGTSEGRLHLQQEPKTSNLKPTTSTIMSVFKSERQAKEALVALAKEYKLCHKLLGLQKTTGACFMHQLKICPGACVGKESPLEYLFRFNQAFADTRIKEWPYPSAIVITEQSSDKLTATSYIINQWCVVGVIKHRDQDVEEEESQPVFDLDQYKILKRYIENPKNTSRIRPYDATHLVISEQ